MLQIARGSRDVPFAAIWHKLDPFSGAILIFCIRIRHSEFRGPIWFTVAAREQGHEPANFALELTRGPFAGTEKVNCMASRWPHFAPSEALVSRGGQRAALRPGR